MNGPPGWHRVGPDVDAPATSRIGAPGRASVPALDSLAFVGLLLVAPWPFWRLAASTPVRQRPRDQVLLVAVLVAYGLSVVLVAMRWPSLLPVLALIAVVIVAAVWWRSRSSHGRADGLPPGRIRLHPLEPFDDVDYLLREAARYGPIFKIGATFPIPTTTPIICVVGHDLGLELLRDHESSLEVYPPFPASRFIPRGFLRSMTAEDHDRYAPIFRQAVTRAADPAFEASVAAAARRLVDRMAADSAAAGDRGIDPVTYLRGFAFEVMARLSFGFEPGSPEQVRLAERFRALNVSGIARRLPQGTRQRRWAEVVAEVEAELGRDGPAPHVGVLREALALASDTPAPDPDRERDTIVGNVLQMQESGSQDLAGLLVWVVKHLGDHPVWLDRVRDDGHDAASRSLAERVIRESLRLEQSEFLNRRMTEDIQFRGYRFPKGWRVRVCIREGHRSPDVFERPIEFDPDRWLGRTHPLTEYAPFGLYRHHCLAARLTQRVGAILVEELARSTTLTITRDGPREHGRFHWQPSHRLRIALEPRDPSKRAERP
jgi:cytochrome P450